MIDKLFSALDKVILLQNKNIRKYMWKYKEKINFHT